MSVLASLNRAYDRMFARSELPPFGYSRTAVGFCVVIKHDGCPAFAPVDMREISGRKLVGRRKNLPTPLVQRTSGIAPNFLWDKTAYSLGITSGKDTRTEDEHGKFIDFHRKILRNTRDDGLLAFRNFIENWEPRLFSELNWPDEMKDENIVFALEGEYRTELLHERTAANELWQAILLSEPATHAICLVSGERERVARSHPPIKNVWNAQSSGAFIVSYNANAYESYNNKEGDNAPVSEAAAFAYTTALNKFLESGSKNRIQIGDASTVFWADASDAEVAKTAEDVFLAMYGTVDETVQAGKVGAILDKIRNGQPLNDFTPGIEDAVHFYVLGLAPNAARLSVRFWLESSFGQIAENYRRFVDDMRIEPPPRNANAPLWQYLAETAAMNKRENVPPNLAGEWMRAILTGGHYPLTLLSTVLMRLRADKDINALRIAMLKAVLIRNFEMEAPVAFDPENDNKGYLLGRLFAVYEHVQSAALGRNVNATIKDKFYGSASAQPRKVFTLLESGSANHLSKVGKQSPGYRINLEKLIGGIMEKMSPGDDPFPSSLRSEQQALFGLGYHHQRAEFFKSRKDETTAMEEAS